MSPRERPMLFSGPMVSAILAGRKTVTRRLVTPQPTNPHRGIFVWKNDEHFPESTFGMWMAQRCPYGQPGDRLWVKETWRTAAKLDGKSPTAIAEAAEDAGYTRPWAPLQYEADGARVNWHESDWGPPGKTRVSIHMPRWASRLTLEVTGVRVERLQDITDEDARAEGCDVDLAAAEGFITYASDTRPMSVKWFNALWERINGAESWATNPWVWRIQFARVTS
ncbi:hypothetical protein Mx8p14 [Myxococcus phage Mx8]|uniref:p14 n=1 Tax=Myxococcus phage Mx8 TaxID=49964 RepID=O03965_9CAUD|nr:hypothetical protein Mx8p14 [Myxococcus phage Mx8]AAC48907.1 unknown [Myxococcus phage Mx8]AAK94349.1 p14 [Myxococcus phage Mx8]